MPNRSNGENLPAWTASALLLTPLILFCVRYLDIPVANYVRSHFFVTLHWSRLVSNLPDLLLLVVLLTTSVALLFYQVRTRKGLNDATTRLAKLVTWAAPTSYLAKSALKIVFGRVNTRVWLQEPSLYGFHWFQNRPGCEGFPSGHMVVIVTLLAVLWRFHPKSRPWCLILGLFLGVALIVTNYHFLSDVIAGAYLGVLVEAVVFRLLLRESRHPENSAP